jgi:hypothetical protein
MVKKSTKAKKSSMKSGRSGSENSKNAKANAKALGPATLPTESPFEAHFFSGRSIADLDLVSNARQAAELLQSQHPSVIFTSGRRSSSQQANAMAPNVVQNRNWIRDTYSASTERDSLQSWVDQNPTIATASAIASGLLNIMSTWSDEQRRKLSRHFSGQAFDVQPVAGALGNQIKASMQNLPNRRYFTDNEGDW